MINRETRLQLRGLLSGDSGVREAFAANVIGSKVRIRSIAELEDFIAKQVQFTDSFESRAIPF